MNRAAVYLNRRLEGQAYADLWTREQYAVGPGGFTQLPQFVVIPHSTEDITRTLKFCWQLAEKGTQLPVVARGSGSDATGAAQTHGAAMDLSQLSGVEEYDGKQGLLRMQAGATITSCQAFLSQYDQELAVDFGNFEQNRAAATIGGAIAGNKFAYDSGAVDAIDRLEVVLSNGTTIETGYLSRRDVEQKKQLTGFEGEIYRGIDTIYEEYVDTISMLSNQALPSGLGYPGIGQLRDEKGGMDLTPLFVGSQGTLGIISEIIMRVGPKAQFSGGMAIKLAHGGAMYRAAEDVLELEPTQAAILAGSFAYIADASGRMPADFGAVSSDDAIMICRWDNVPERKMSKIFKRIAQLFQDFPEGMLQLIEDESDVLWCQLQSLQEFAVARDERGFVPKFFGRMAVPSLDGNDFRSRLGRIEAAQKVALPWRYDMNSGEIYFYPVCHNEKLVDRQGMMGLLMAVSEVVQSVNGVVVASGGEGQIKAATAFKAVSDAEMALHEAIRALFDPHRILQVAAKRPVQSTTIMRQIGPGGA